MVRTLTTAPRALARGAIAASLLTAGVFAVAGNAQTVAKTATGNPRLPERGIRRDIPLTNMIRRAFDAGTRDSTGRPGRNYWQLWTDYKINARFDTATSTVTGHEVIVVRNNSTDSLTSIRVRLDQNLFAPNVPRNEEVTEITDGMKVSKIIVNGMTVDLNAPRGGRGGAGGGRGARGGGAPVGPAVATATGLNTTSATIRPAAAIAPKASATLEFDWSFRVPRADNVRGIRMGRWADTLYQVAQWYPRVAVYDDLRQGGWDDDPYLGPSEFYNNFGHFDLTLDVPAGWLVGATGVLQNPEQVLTADARERLSHVLESDSQRTIVSATQRGPGKSTAAGDRLMWHFVADSVADVAWATSNQFVFDATRANIPGRGYIPVQFFYLAGNAGVRAGSAAAGAAAGAGRGNFGGGANTTCIGTPTITAAGGRGFANQGPVARHALEFYSKLWMPYAFPQLVQVDGPEGGMEYPMFIMAAGSTDHETGHQWWPMMVGVNETWYGFMDEGFNQYMNRLSACDRTGQQPNLDGWGQQYGNTSGNEREAPLMWDANYGGPNYSFQAYTKAPFMLSMLGAVVGDTAVWHAMSDYAKTWRFKHPSPWDYMFFMNNALKQDLGWFWNAWLFTTESVDGSIQSVTTTGNKTAVVVREDGQMPSPVILRVQLAAKGGAIAPMAGAKKVDSLSYDVTYPVNVWFPGSKTFTANLNFGARKIEKITFDPGRRFPDRNPCDNSWPKVTTDPSAAAPVVGGRGGGRGGAPRC